MGNSLFDGFIFLISTIFNLYLYILIVRLILAWKRSNYHTNLIAQFVVKLTRFIVNPLKKWIPNFQGIELATLVIILFLDIIKWFFILIPSVFPHPLGLFILAISDILKLTIQLFFYAILIQAILSWVQPQSPLNWSLYELTSPIMKPFQRYIPPISSFDISPIVVIIVLQLLIIIFINPLIALGWGIAI